MLKCLRTYYGRHCEPFSGQNYQHFQGLIPNWRAPGAWTQTQLQFGSPVFPCQRFYETTTDLDGVSRVWQKANTINSHWNYFVVSSATHFLYKHVCVDHYRHCLYSPPCPISLSFSCIASFLECSQTLFGWCTLKSSLVWTATRFSYSLAPARLPKGRNPHRSH